MYEPKRVIEIMENFQKRLVEADNFPKDQDPKDYKKFWIAYVGMEQLSLGLQLFY